MSGTKEGNVESFTYHEWYRPCLVPSQYVPDKLVDDVRNSVLQCPACGRYGTPLEHGKTKKCENCNINMRKLGNSLSIWR